MMFSQVRILDFNPTEAVNFEAEIQSAEAEDITQASGRSFHALRCKLLLRLHGVLIALECGSKLANMHVS